MRKKTPLTLAQRITHIEQLVSALSKSNSECIANDVHRQQAVEAFKAHMACVIAEHEKRVKSAIDQFVAASLERDSQLRKSIGEESSHRLTLANEQRAYVDRADAFLRLSVSDLDTELAAVGTFMKRGIMGRLKWLVFGR
jgi:hypothetical protein